MRGIMTGNALIKRLSKFIYTCLRYLMPDNYQDDIGLFIIKKILGCFTYTTNRIVYEIVMKRAWSSQMLWNSLWSCEIVNFIALWTCYELLSVKYNVMKSSETLMKCLWHHNHEKMSQFGTISQSYLQNFSLSNIIFLLNENILGCWT